MKIVGANSITGNPGSLDKIPDIHLVDGDVAFVKDGMFMYYYRLDDDSGQSINIPYVISTDNLTSDKRWLLQGIFTDNLITKDLTTNTITSSGNLIINSFTRFNNGIDVHNGASFTASIPFTVSNNSLIHNLNAEYLDGHSASEFIVKTSGKENLSLNSNSITISLGYPMIDTSYNVFTEIENIIDTNPSIYSTIISNKTTTDFTVDFSGNIDSSNYKINWLVF
jgi:hypothetical protein